MIVSDNPSFPSPPDGRHGWPWTDIGGVPLEPPVKSEATPRVTVITPSFNQGKYLEEAIRSVVLQDHPNLEYIVMDGGSTDSSVDVIKRYEPWISYWVSKPDDGQADAINTGFARATGDYLCWLNADDVLYQGFLSRRVEEFGSRPRTDLIYGDIDTGWSEETRTVLKGEPPSFLDMLRTLRVAVPQQGAMWRRTTVQHLGGLDPRWHVVLDREFFLRIIQRGRAEYIPGRCGFFRQHDGAKSVAQATAWVAELPLMYVELFDGQSLEPRARRLENETMASVHLLCADILRAAHNWSGSLNHLTKAFRRSPAHALSSFLTARVGGLRRRLVGRVNRDGAHREASP